MYYLQKESSISIRPKYTSAKSSSVVRKFSPNYPLEQSLNYDSCHIFTIGATCLNVVWKKNEKSGRETSRIFNGRSSSGAQFRCKDKEKLSHTKCHGRVLRFSQPRIFFLDCPIPAKSPALNYIVKRGSTIPFANNNRSIKRMLGDVVTHSLARSNDTTWEKQ